jgi:multiple sugar transport system substrate-binding protein
MKRNKKTKSVVLIIAASLIIGAFSVSAIAEKTTINVLASKPHSAVVDYFGSDWENMTGVKINKIEVPYPVLFDKVMTDLVTETGAFDLICVAAGWAGDFVGGGWVIPLEGLMEKYDYPDWEDVAPAIQKVVKWGPRIYALPYDGDCHNFYYRRDALENPDYQAKFEKKYGYRYNVPPKTWEEVRDIAEFFNGWDWDNDGEIEYGIEFIAKRKTQAQWSLMDIAAQYAVLRGGPDKYHGMFFFDPETMEPLVNTPGWIEGMKMIQEFAKYGPPGILSYGYSEERITYVKGLCAMAFDWGDIGVMEQDPEKYGSTVKGLLGYSPLPGAKKVWDRKEGRWLYQHNQINFLDFGGWIWCIPKTSKKATEAYKFGTFVTDPERSLLEVTGVAYTGANPWRITHFTELNKWLEAGWDKESALNYLEALRGILDDPEALLDLRIPGTAEYYDYLDLYLSKVLAGEMAPDDACKKVYEAWEDITDKYGKEKQLNLYRESLGLKPL